VVVAAPASEPPTPPLSSVDEEDWLQVQPDNWDVQSVQSYKVNKNIVAQQAMGSTSTLVEAAETAMRTALATAEAMAERRRCGAAGNKHSKQNRPKSQRMAHRSRSCGVAKVNEAMSEEATVRAASVERSVVLDSDAAITSKGVPGIWDSALKLIHSVKTCKDAKKEADATTPSTRGADDATPTVPRVSRKSQKAYRNKEKVLGMLKMVQSDFALLEAEKKTAEGARKEENTNAGTRASHTAASSAEREDSFERWRRELRAQAGLDESDLDHSLRHLVRDPISGTI